MCNVVELFIQITNQTKSNDSNIWIFLIAPSFTLLGVMIAGIIQYYNTKKQIQTTEKLKSLQEIRLKSSELYSNFDMHYNLLKRLADLCKSSSMVNKEKRENKIEQLQEKMDDLAQKAMFQCNFLTALLDNNQPKHKEIIDTVNYTQKFLLKFVENINKQTFTDGDPEYIKLKKDFFSLLTLIIKDIDKI